MPRCMWWSEDSCESALCILMLLSGLEFRAAGLKADALTHWAILPRFKV